MSHSIKAKDFNSLDFSMGERNFIIYLYGSLKSESYCGEQCWSGIGESKVFTREEIIDSYKRLESMHSKESLIEHEKRFSNLPEDLKEKRVTHFNSGSIFIENPPCSREDAFFCICDWYETLLENDFETININFS